MNWTNFWFLINARFVQFKTWKSGSSIMIMVTCGQTLCPSFCFGRPGRSNTFHLESINVKSWTQNHGHIIEIFQATIFYIIQVRALSINVMNDVTTELMIWMEWFWWRIITGSPVTFWVPDWTRKVCCNQIMIWATR